MSDEHHYAGGHELEGLNAGGLLRIVVGLGLVTLLSATAVVQWFYRQREQLILERADEGSFMLHDHRKEMAQRLEGIDRTVTAVLEAPGSMGTAVPPPAGWVHPDDIATGGRPAAPGPAPVEPLPSAPEPVPTEPVPTEPAPAGEKESGSQ
jgi:hypothetical protein